MSTENSIKRLPEKFTRFTFRELSDEERTDPLFREVMTDLAKRASVLDLMKYYARETRKDLSTESPYFAKLQKIFDCSVAPGSMAGYLHGAVVAFRNEGLLNLFDVNTFNLAWPLVRLFSPWTGKTFEPIAAARLAEMTGGFEAGNLPTAWGSNTYSSRKFQEKVAVDVMGALNIWLEEATLEERKSRDYDVKGFFFIGREGQSVNPANSGRAVYQFNYRWPALRTFPPDNFCLDEIVQIAEGLFLGQLVYATNLTKAYDPSADPAQYDYRNFGYFLLMDEEWQRRRQRIRFEV
jgi:hypothetical protein